MSKKHTTAAVANAAAPSRGEDGVQYSIMVVIGGVAAAASFTHVHDWSVKAGQADWIGWANAVVLELMAVAAGLEIKRRRRTEGPIGFPATVVAASVLLSLTAQVADAPRTIFGWLSAAIPALAFLALVKIIVGRPAASPTSAETERHEETPAAATAPPEPVTAAPSNPQRPAPIWPAPSGPVPAPPPPPAVAIMRTNGS